MIPRFSTVKKIYLLITRYRFLSIFYRNERTATSKRTLQFSVGICEKRSYHYLTSGISEVFCQMLLSVSLAIIIFHYFFIFVNVFITNPYSVDTSIKRTRITGLFLLLKTSIKRTPDWIYHSSIGLRPWNTYWSRLIKINQYI